MKLMIFCCQIPESFLEFTDDRWFVTRPRVRASEGNLSIGHKE